VCCSKLVFATREDLVVVVVGVARIPVMDEIKNGLDGTARGASGILVESLLQPYEYSLFAQHLVTV
jgi:hypothetical protein